MLISKGNPMLMGCSRYKDGYNFTYEAECENAALLIFDAHMKPKERIEPVSYTHLNVPKCRHSHPFRYLYYYLSDNYSSYRSQDLPCRMRNGILMTSLNHRDTITHSTG